MLCLCVTCSCVCVSLCCVFTYHLLMCLCVMCYVSYVYVVTCLCASALYVACLYMYLHYTPRDKPPPAFPAPALVRSGPPHLPVWVPRHRVLPLALAPEPVSAPTSASSAHGRIHLCLWPRPPHVNCMWVSVWSIWAAGVSGGAELPLPSLSPPAVPTLHS